MYDNIIIRLFVLYCAILLSVCSMADDQGKKWLKMANEQYEKKQYDIAVGYYLKAAEFDETEAQFNLGYALFNGEGIKQDFPSAVMWFKRAANKQYPKAEYNLAFCYMNGKGAPCDYDKALQLLISAAKHGLPAAQITLAECYERGVLVEQNIAESKRWKELAESNNILLEAEDTVIQQPSSEGSKITPKKDDTDEHLDPPLINVQLDGELVSKDANPLVQKLPKKVPVLKILYPKDQSFFHTDIVKVKYQLLADGLESSTKIKVMVDAVKKNLDENRTVKQANVIDVEVPNRDCTITMYAQNEVGNSEPVSIRLIRENVAQGDLPRLFCVAIGVGDYHDEKLPPLKLATKDARDFASAVAKKQGLPFSDVQVKVLTDKEATREDMFEALEWLQQETTPNDICMFFYAGHGYRDQKDRFYFMPYGGTTDKLYNCFSSANFKDMAEDINCKMIVFVDACFSAALFEGYRSAATTHFLEQLRRTKNGAMLYASSAENKRSKENPAWGNGAFTKALISAFNGGARQQFDEGLSTQTLYNYLYNEVMRITNFEQAPVWNSNGMEPFNIFIYEN